MNNYRIHTFIEDDDPSKTRSCINLSLFNFSCSMRSLQSRINCVPISFSIIIHEEIWRNMKDLWMKYEGNTKEIWRKFSTIHGPRNLEKLYPSIRAKNKWKFVRSSFKIYWASQKMKIMFHVFQYGGEG